MINLYKELNNLRKIANIVSKIVFNIYYVIVLLFTLTAFGPFLIHSMCCTLCKMLTFMDKDTYTID